MYDDVGLSYTGYFFVGVTTFVLAYVTINDSTKDEKMKQSDVELPSAASIVPESISKPIAQLSQSVSETVEDLNPFSDDKEKEKREVTGGGKSRCRSTKKKRLHNKK